MSPIFFSGGTTQQGILVHDSWKTFSACDLIWLWSDSIGKQPNSPEEKALGVLWTSPTFMGTTTRVDELMVWNHGNRLIADH